MEFLFVVILVIGFLYYNGQKEKGKRKTLTSGKPNKKLNEKNKPIDGWYPLAGLENEIHIKKIEKYTEGGVYAIFHFPEFTKDYFTLEIIEDEFTGKKTLKPHNIHSMRNDKVMMFSDFVSVFYMGLLSEIDKHYITFAAYRKEIKFNKGDKISLLFENEEIWDISLSEKGYRIDKDNEGVIYEAKEQIPIESIETLTKTKLIKWRYFDSKTERSFTSPFDKTRKRNIIEMSKMMKIGISQL